MEDRGLHKELRTRCQKIDLEEHGLDPVLSPSHFSMTEE